MNIAFIFIAVILFNHKAHLHLIDFHIITFISIDSIPVVWHWCLNHIKKFSKQTLLNKLSKKVLQNFLRYFPSVLCCTPTWHNYNDKLNTRNAIQTNLTNYGVGKIFLVMPSGDEREIRYDQQVVLTVLYRHRMIDVLVSSFPSIIFW